MSRNRASAARRKSRSSSAKKRTPWFSGFCACSASVARSSKACRWTTRDACRRRAAALAGPTIVCIQAGNVNSGAFDPAPALCSGARRRRLGPRRWRVRPLGRASRPGRPPEDGFEQADSWATDAHKWLNVPYDCGIGWFANSDGVARRDVDQRRLPAAGWSRCKQFHAGWLAAGSGRGCVGRITVAGASGLAELIDRNCDQAKWLAEQLSAADVEVLNNVVLNQVVVSFGDDACTKK